MLLAGVDAHEGGTVVQRRELGQLVYLVDDVLVDEHRAVEVLAALNDAVPHGVDLVERVDGLRRARRERFQDERHGVVVVGHLGVDDLLVLVEAVLVEGLRRAHALADALREQLVLLHVHQLVLQGR